MATHRITSAHAEKSKVQIEFESEPGVVHTLNVPKWHYRPKAVVLESKEWIKKQKELFEKKERDDEATELELMLFTLSLIDPENYLLVDDLTMGEQFEIWQVWSGDIPVTEGESTASSAS